MRARRNGTRSVILLCIVSVIAIACFAVADVAAAEQPWPASSVLRARDLTPFGLLRLDMRPATMHADPVDRWTFELQAAYQNTFIASENVKTYLQNRNAGRAPIRPQDVQAILALPGDAYYLDVEVGAVDLVLRRGLTEALGVFFELPYLHYSEGRFDSWIEAFHSAFGMGQMGRDLVARDRFQMIYRLGDVQHAQLDRDREGGFGDPIVGVRYASPWRGPWDLTVETAMKLAVAGQRPLLSTGKHDIGAQAALQRRSGRHALYGSLSAVYYSGGMPESPEAQVIPTLVLAYTFAATHQTSFVVQSYTSRSVVRDTGLSELKANKYQLSFGVQSRIRDWKWSLALTENIANFDNTPDIGAQLALTH